MFYQFRFLFLVLSFINFGFLICLGWSSAAEHRCLVHVRCPQVSCQPCSCCSSRLLPLWYQPSPRRCHRCPTASQAATETVPSRLFSRSVPSGRDEGRL